MLVKWQNPARSLFPVNNDFDRAFDEFFNTRSIQPRYTELNPRINVEENENAWIVSAELPGVEKEDVQVNFQDSVLTISGEKKFAKEEKEKNFHRIERSYGKFSRSLNVNAAVVSDKIDAEYKNGVLTVTLVKAEEAKPKTIEVKIK